MDPVASCYRAGQQSTVEGLDAGADIIWQSHSPPMSLWRVCAPIWSFHKSGVKWAKQLEEANKELESFSYSVSHDLRAPLRAIDGFTAMFLEDYAEQFDDRGRGYLERVRTGIKQMSEPIDGLLDLSRMSRAVLQKESIDLTELAHDVMTELQHGEPARKIVVEIADGLTASGDPRLVKIVLVNLLGNAWKYTAKQPEAHIAFREETKGSIKVSWFSAHNEDRRSRSNQRGDRVRD